METDNLPSMMIRTGSSNPSVRAVRRGSSAAIVPAPAMTAAYRPRSVRTSSLDSSDEIHCDFPVWHAVFPSMDTADLYRTKGFFSVINFMKTSFKTCASFSITPVVTKIPASFSFRMPFPDTSGFGSCMATTTRSRFLDTMRSAQGGVFP